MFLSICRIFLYHYYQITFIFYTLLIDCEVKIGTISIEVLDIDFALFHMVEIESFGVGGLDEH
jgi:hypothetical protein